MREILFRGKRIDNGEWVEGCLLKVTLNGKTAHLIFGDNFSFDGHDVKALSHALVDPSTVGQFTGLTDKNGERIFEGDRVVYPDGTSYSSYDDYNEGVVDYDEEAMRFYFTDRWSVEMEDFDVVDGVMVDVEIIGTIHDNPELMEVHHE